MQVLYSGSEAACRTGRMPCQYVVSCMLLLMPCSFALPSRRPFATVVSHRLSVQVCATLPSLITQSARPGIASNNEYMQLSLSAAATFPRSLVTPAYSRYICQNRRLLSQVGQGLFWLVTAIRLYQAWCSGGPALATAEQARHRCRYKLIC